MGIQTFLNPNQIGLNNFFLKKNLIHIYYSGSWIIEEDYAQADPEGGPLI